MRNRTVLREILQRHLASGEATSIEDEALLSRDIGLDSVQLGSFLLDVEARFGCTIPEQWILETDVSLRAIDHLLREAESR